MGDELPDAKRYVAVYEALGVNVRRKCNRHLHEEPPARQLDVFHPNTTGQTVYDPSVLQAPLHAELNYPSHFPSSGAFLGRDDTAGLHANAAIHDTPLSDNSLLPWDLLNDDSLWNMEAGLNEYAYGDPPATLYANDPFDLSMFQ
jgi:hypothetical protein